MSDREAKMRTTLERIKDALAEHEYAWWDDGHLAVVVRAEDVQPENLRICTGRRPNSLVTYESFQRCLDNGQTDEQFERSLQTLLGQFRLAGRSLIRGIP